MLVRVYEMDGLLALLLALPIIARLITPRLALPRIVYRLGAALAFCGWLLFAASGGSISWSQPGPVGYVYLLYLFFAPVLLPVEAGYLAWLGLGLSSRWLLLELILAAGLPPIIAGLVIRLLGS
jgi:hypothetical protein